ncbi:hypothetical protein EYR36_003215 [Pleurotus pulmonarius]|nr:hypothetical protein EYR36_003215 [Pleurotus pulmonarius]
METQYSYVRPMVVLPLRFLRIIGCLLAIVFNVTGHLDKQEVSVLLNVARVSTYVVQPQREARRALREFALLLCSSQIGRVLQEQTDDTTHFVRSWTDDA